MHVTVHRLDSYFVACFHTEILPVQLSADTPRDLASELVHYAFINEVHGKIVFILLIFKDVTIYCSEKSL